MATSRIDRSTTTAATTRPHRARAPDIGRPASTLPKFTAAKFWDADSTPPSLACLSRSVAQWAPRSGARTPDIEASVVLASLMHDVAYYYGGSMDDKARADQLFGAQIPAFVQRLDPNAVAAAKVTSAVDVAAVKLGGGVPFDQSYSWSYGFKQADRGYATLDAGENAKIDELGRAAFKEVVAKIATGNFEPNAVLKGKLAQASPEYQAQVKASIVKLAKSLQRELAADGGKNLPGFGR